MAIKVDQGTSPTTYSFTPVRRRPSSFSSKYLQEGTGKEWTAVRCHRLLRPLTSRVAILDKDFSRFPSATAGCLKRQRQSRSTGPSQERTKSEDSQGSDADWGQQQPRKRLKRTYSGRAGKRRASKHEGWENQKASSMSSGSRDIAAPGSITVSTPLLTRSIEPTAKTAAEHIEQDVDIRGLKRYRPRCAAQDNHAYRQLLQLRKVLPAARYSTYEGIYNGFEALLKATRTTSDKLRVRESKSLFSMCLRSVPYHIAEQTELHCRAAKDSGNKSALDMPDISLEIYDDLESLGSSGCGWKHLRAVVRSHGIQIITNAVDRGLLDISFCGALVSLCASTNDLDAGESILSSVLNLETIPTPNTVFCRLSSESTSRSMYLLWDFAKRSHRNSYHLRQITQMLAGGHIASAWLATKDFGQIWTMAIQILSTEPDNTDAANYLQTALSTLISAGVRETGTINTLVQSDKNLARAIEQTYSSLLTTLAGIALLSQERSVAAASGVLAADGQVTSAIITILEYCLAECLSVTRKQHCLWIVLLLLRRCTDMFTSNLAPSKSNDLVVGQTPLRTEVAVDSSVLAELICSISACCARAGFSPQLSYLQKMHSILETSLLSGSSEDHAILTQIIIDSAFGLSEDVPDREHVDYAADISTRFEASNHNQRPGSICGKSKHITSSEFRWEEGISEWVTATPAFNARKSKVVVEYESMDESENETPYRPSCTRRTALHRRCANPSSCVPDKAADGAHDNSTISAHLLAEAAFTSMSSQGSEVAHQDTILDGLRSQANITLGQADVNSSSYTETSDDELSFSLSTSQLESTVSKPKHVSRRRLVRAAIRSKSDRMPSDLTASLLDDSEDELCI